MIMNKFFWFIIICLTSFSLKAQIIKGTIFHKNEVVPFASIIVRKSDSIKSILQFTKTNKE
jgi:hypothetical protein